MLRRGLRNACFSRKRRRENGTDDTEKLRRWQNSTDSSAVLFLVRKGSLGTLSTFQGQFLPLRKDHSGPFKTSIKVTI